FFQAEDGIRVGHVTGVQTCALPIFARYEESAAWRTVGQVLDFTSSSIVVQGNRRDRVVLTPSGRRVSLAQGSGPEFLELDEQGRSEERRVGKRGRCMWELEHSTKKQ